MTAAPTLDAARAETIVSASPNTDTSFSTPVSAVRGLPRLILRAEAGLLLAAALVAYGHEGGSWLRFALLFLLPDLSMLGYLAGPRIGAAAYDAGHSTVGPALLAGLALLLGAHGVLLVALIWLAHIGFDRVLGYGLKYGSAFGHTHLGVVGRDAKG